MITVNDYYNLLDHDIGITLDTVASYTDDEMDFSELLNCLYKNFISSTPLHVQKAAHDIIEEMLNLDIERFDAEKEELVASHIKMWAYDSISHGI